MPYSDYQATNFNFFITVPNNAGSVTIFFTVPYNAYPDTVAVPNNATLYFDPDKFCMNLFLAQNQYLGPMFHKII